MKVIYYLTALLVLFASCQPNSGSTDSTGNSEGTAASESKSAVKAQKGTAPSGLEYTLHSGGEGEKAKFGDFLTLNMQYATMSDSVIFSSYKKSKPLSFKFQKTLFKGVLNDGLTMMAAGDSATFLVSADSLYGERMPKFLGSGDKIKYTISLDKIQTQQEYQTEQKAIRDKQLGEDAKQIDAYLNTNNIKVEKTPSGLQYTIAKQGATAIPADVDNVMLKYKAKLLNGTEVESTEGKSKELMLARQTKGLREGIQLLKKGGKGTLYVPSVLAYGDRQRGKIPPNSVLIYDVEVTDFSKKKAK